MSLSIQNTLDSENRIEESPSNGNYPYLYSPSLYSVVDAIVYYAMSTNRTVSYSHRRSLSSNFPGKHIIFRVM